LQPVSLFVPLLHVRFSVPIAPVVHFPSQVMLHVPLEHETVEFAPTVWVHDLPAQSTVQLAPQVPEHVPSLPHEYEHPLIDALHASNAHV
jgi:hypothetical protein